MKRICPIHGLWNKKYKEDRCPKCNKQYDRTYRNKSSRKIYDSKKWREDVRPSILFRDGMRCVKCGSNINLIVDHIHELKDGGDPFDENNLETLCKKCHAVKTAKEKAKRNA